MRGKWVLFGGIVIFTAIGLGALSWWKRDHVVKPKPAAPAELAAGTELTFNGQIQAVKFESIAAPIGGILEEFPVRPGDEIAEGQVLGRIKNDALEEGEKEAALQFERAQDKVTTLQSGILSARLEVSRAEADATRARLDYERAERVYQRQAMLHKEGATPRKTYEAAAEAYGTAKGESEQADATRRNAQECVTQLEQDLEVARKSLAEKQEQLDAARQDLQACEIRAPEAGVIISIAKQAGEPVDKGFPDLIRYSTDISQLEIPLDLEPKILQRLQPGFAAVVQTPELPGGIAGAVREIKDNRVIVEFTSPTPAVRPGMQATVRLRLP